MTFQLVLKLTLNDLERHNDHRCALSLRWLGFLFYQRREINVFQRVLFLLDASFFTLVRQSLAFTYFFADVM